VGLFIAIADGRLARAFLLSVTRVRGPDFGLTFLESLILCIIKHGYVLLH
jgi:hypothetical protein